MSIIRPRCKAIVTFPVSGSNVPETFEIKVKHVQIERNDFNHCDTCTIRTDFKDAGIDPRLLSDGTLVLYLGNAVDEGYWEPTDGDIQFVGIMRRPRRSGHSDGDGLEVELLFHDYTSLFLEARLFPSTGIPDLSMTLSQAWALICDHIGPTDPDTGKVKSVVTALRDRLVLDGIGDVTLSKAVAKRFQKLGKVQPKPGADAWAVWQQCVGMLGLISYIDGDKCVVTTADTYYKGLNPPRMIWGDNILELDENRDTRISVGGVGVTSFDPLTGTTLEALWPPVGDPSIKRKKMSAKKVKSADDVRQGEQREYFQYQGVTDDSILLDIARRIFEERSRQDLEGTLTTHELEVSTLGLDTFNLLSLRAGDVIRVEVDQAATAYLGNLDSDDERISYLVGLGYNEGLARLLVRNFALLPTLKPNYLVKRLSVTLDLSSDSLQFSIGYINRIDIEGNAK